MRTIRMSDRTASRIMRSFASPQAIPVRSPCNSGRTKLLMSQRRRGDALPHLEVLREALPGISEVAAQCALALRQLSRLDEAAASLDASLADHPNMPEALVERGSLALNAGDDQKEADPLGHAQQLDPSLIGARNFFLQALARLGRADEIPVQEQRIRVLAASISPTATARRRGTTPSSIRSEAGSRSSTTKTTAGSTSSSPVAGTSRGKSSRPPVQALPQPRRPEIHRSCPQPRDSPSRCTRVVVETALGTQTKFVKGGASYASTDDARVHLGLGGDATVRKVTVHWSHGGTQDVPPPAVDG
jgi:hypothetical protein